MTIASSERFDIENDLRLALLNQQFELYYQPQVIAESGEIFAVEALMRWKHPVHGFIPPDKFIPELERNGLIIEVGKWVLQQAASQLNEWKKSGYSIRMAVNISSRQLEDGHLPGYIRKLLVAESIEPHELELELTESCLMKNPVYAISLLNELNDIGIYLALDDFGTGYSSLSYLKKVPIQTLKIDKSFVRDILTDQNDRAIATTIIAMAKSLELKVIAEGVETEEQLKFLQQSRCDYIQGYYFSKPVSAGELELVLTENRTSILRSAPALRSVS
ncbi:EAL domain-containing protein, partial [bacterium]|nr:EAL domain-containing protein [bacterium]